MEEISGNEKNLRTILLGNNYTINYYQREYGWKRKQIEEMIEDLTSEFLNNYSKNDSRVDGDKYGVYFMGSIVLSKNEKAIIDGQQRLTSLTLLLIYLNNRLKAIGESSGLEQMIYSERRGVKSFNINVPERNECMEALYNGEDFDTKNAADSVRNLYDRYNDIVDLFPQSEVSDEILLHFCDWLEDKLMFVEIEATTDQDAHKVFVSLNDRGLNLTSTEMLKGYLLSEVQDDYKRKHYNDKWKEVIQELKNTDEKNDENFIRVWLRSQFAQSIRETKKGAENKDFDLIGGSFHKWVRDERSKLGLDSSEGYEDFLDQMIWFADRYLEIIEAEQNFSEELPYVYYNASLGFTLQPQLLMASLRFKDSPEVIRKKLNLVSRFIDLYIVSRVVNYNTVNYSTIKNYIFNVTKAIRGKDVEEIKEVLYQYYCDLNIPVRDKLTDFGRNNFTKKYIKSMLARMLDYLERGSDMAPKYLEYMDTTQKDPYEVEHILCDHYELFEDKFTSQEDFNTWRNKFGSLLLLRKSINASLNDSPYSKKLPAYEAVGKGNLLSASLGKELYKNNPRFVHFADENRLNFKPFGSFGKEEITQRISLYGDIMEKVWNTDIFRLESTGELPDIERRSKRERFSFDKIGLKPGDTIEYVSDSEIKATVVSNNKVEYDGKEWFLSSLASHLTGKENLQGPLFFTYNGIVLDKLRND